jgi:putative transposase
VASAASGKPYPTTFKQQWLQPGDKWFLDEVFVRIRGKLNYF